MYRRNFNKFIKLSLFRCHCTISISLFHHQMVATHTKCHKLSYAIQYIKRMAYLQQNFEISCSWGSAIAGCPFLQLSVSTLSTSLAATGDVTGCWWQTVPCRRDGRTADCCCGAASRGNKGAARPVSLRRNSAGDCCGSDLVPSCKHCRPPLPVRLTETHAAFNTSIARTDRSRNLAWGGRPRRSGETGDRPRAVRALEVDGFDRRGSARRTANSTGKEIGRNRRAPWSSASPSAATVL